MKRYLAIDIGASSGRHIIGWRDDSRICTDEVYRFANGMEETGGHLTWNVDRILTEVKAGIRAALTKYADIESLSVDTWGVDYVLMRGDEAIFPCYAYRDNRTESVIADVHGQIPLMELYSLTGIQFQPFNTIYQLYADKLSGRLDGVTDFLMLPEYLMYKLTGVKTKEYTNATTTGLINARTKQYETSITERLGLPEELFKPLAMPGTVAGELLPSIAQEVGGKTRVVLCATHDTASAVEGMDVPDNAVFLSSGTWSLLGVKLSEPLTNGNSLSANFTNEGGAGYIRYLKNIMGLWIVQCLQKQLALSFDEMTALAETSNFTEIFDVNDLRFIAPADMKREVYSALGNRPATDSDIINSVYHSLAFSYNKAINELEQNTGLKLNTLYVAGGGAKDKYLNVLTAKYTGKDVVSLPMEAAARGNIKIQMEADSGTLCKRESAV
jgi:rhamnulokinase